MSIVEKIDHLIDLKAALEKRLRIIESGREIYGWEYTKYPEYMDQKTQAILNNTW